MTWTATGGEGSELSPSLSGRIRFSFRVVQLTLEKNLNGWRGKDGVEKVLTGNHQTGEDDGVKDEEKCEPRAARGLFSRVDNILMGLDWE